MLHKHLCSVGFLCFTLIFPTHSLTAKTIVINELMASNARTLLDEDAVSVDWIELYNASDIAVNLANFRISNVFDSGVAWIIPDTIIQPGGFLLLHASGNDRAKAMNREIVATGQGIESWASRDGFRFDYIPLTGDCTAQVRIRKLKAENIFAKSGIIIRESLENDSKFVGTFSTESERKVFVYSYRDTVKTKPKSERYRSVFQNYPDGWLRLARRGDTVRTYASNDGYHWQNDAPIVFHPRNDTVFLGLSVASRSSDEFAVCVYSDFTINGAPVAPSELRTIQISVNGNDLEGHHRELRELHTDFKLKPSGGAVYLWDASGKLMDSARYDTQRVDVSWARQYDGASNFLFNPQPSPAAANSGGTLGIHKAPRCTMESGFYEHTVEVDFELEQPHATIHYTTDGSEPTRESLVYDGWPIVFSATGVLRARAFSAEYLPSSIITRYYIIGEQSNLPIVAIAAAPEDLWDEDDGIFIRTFSEREIYAHMQFWERDRSMTFSADMGIRITGGGGSRSWPQRSLLCRARNLYGPTTLDFPFFAHRDQKSYKRLLLRNAGNDWKAAFLRDGLMARIAESTGLDVQAYRPVASYINGEYWGVYNLRERIDEHYFSEKYHIPKESVDLLENDAEVKEGTSESYRKFLDTLLQPGISLAERMDIAECHVDVENLLDYYAIEVIAANLDWIYNNVKYWRSAAYDGRWRFALFDMDVALHGWSSVTTDMFRRVTEIDNERAADPYPHKIFTTLIEYVPFRNRFLNRFADILNSAFLPERTLPLLDSAIYEISNEIQRHKERWPDSMIDQEDEYTRIRKFLKQRPDATRDNAVRTFQLAGTADVTLTINILGAGALALNSLHIPSTPWKGVYFQGVPVVIHAVPAPGFIFERWSDSTLPQVPKVAVNLSDDRLITAIFRDTVDRSVVINEIMYRPPDDADSEDWVELYNAGKKIVDLSDWTLADNSTTKRYSFSHGVEIAPGEYIVVCEDPEAFSLVYPETTNVVGGFSFGFGSDTGDEVRLFNDADMMIDSVHYLSAPPWPSEANGQGPSLELIRPDLDNVLPEHWKISRTKGGTPGYANERLIETVESSWGSCNYTVSAFPNPCVNFVYLRCENKSERPARALFYNMTGKNKPEILYPKSNSKRESAFAFDVSGLHSGAYVATLQFFSGQNWRSIGAVKLAVRR